MTDAARNPILEVRGLSRSFGGLAAVADLDFDAGRGQIKGIIGPNGAGKTTLFNLVAGVLSPDSGHIVFEGRRIETLPSHRRASLGIARTFQNLQIFQDMSVLENVMVGAHVQSSSGFLRAMLRLPGTLREERRIAEEAYEALATLGIENRAHVDASSLSFGERKILEVARALVARPKVLLLDEPTAGLPHEEVEQVARLVRRIREQGITILLVEHNMRLVMSLCDDILVLNYGRRIAEGPAATVRSDPEVLRAYLGEDADAA